MVNLSTNIIRGKFLFFQDESVLSIHWCVLTANKVQNAEVENEGVDRVTNQPRVERVHFALVRSSSYECPVDLTYAKQEQQRLKKYLEQQLGSEFETHHFQYLIRKIERHMIYLRNLNCTCTGLQRLLEDTEALRLKVKVTLKSIIHEGAWFQEIHSVSKLKWNILLDYN